jgi:hypothetical protein
MAGDPDDAPRALVKVEPGAALVESARLFAALEAAFSVSFEPAEGRFADADAAIVLGDDPASATGPLGRAGVPVLAMGGSRPAATSEPVRLLADGAVDRSLRGIEIRDRLSGPPLAGGEAVDVLGTAAAGAVWTITRAGPRVHRVRAELPELAPDEVLRDLLVRAPLAAIALVHFLREVATADPCAGPPLRAALLFDDPNLHWRTYGFIDYSRLLDHADAHGYHVSMAMIPLDGWFAHRPTAELFRRRPDRLSLVVHGNDHVRGELMRPGSDGRAVALAAQALRRIARFEARSKLRVDRVMTPPHGLCSERAARAVGSLGFDALCAAHPLPWTERPPADRPLAGWDPATFAHGCAVIPRVTFDTPTAELALRAFLRQPLVLYGHHNDVSGGLDLLAETVARVNGLGDVRWTSLATIAATNYAAGLERGALRVRPFSRRLRLRSPARELVVDAPRHGAHGLAGWSAGDRPPERFGVPVPWPDGHTEVRIRGVTELNAADLSAGPRLWPILRRLATETRDRTATLHA